MSASNSLVGSVSGDNIGRGTVYELTNGNYVVTNYDWSNSKGAVTFGNNTTGVSGVVDASNSLVGSQNNDRVGIRGVVALTNGNYVVRSNEWNNAAVADAGAVTFGDGTTGVSGVVSASNSLVGTQTSDQVGNTGVTALTNGNYVVASHIWNNGTETDAGAVTFGNGVTGIAGAVSASNSLVGTQTEDEIGFGGVTALTNGNYVVSSRNWDNGGIANVGAVTFGDGTTGITGAVSAANSLVGTTTSDFVGSSGITALSNGNYVVISHAWDNGAFLNVGAVTFGDGTSGIVGAVSATNSLVGSSTSDFVGGGREWI